MANDGPIETPRLRLVLLQPTSLALLRARDAQAASRVEGFSFSDDFLDTVNDLFLARNLEGRQKWPSDPGWFVRAIVRKSDGEVLGHCGFHGAPQDVGRAEIGYTIFAPYRRRGYAAESAQGLVEWARGQGTSVVFATVAPNNIGSLGVVHRLGFHQTLPQGPRANYEEFVFELAL